MAAFGQVVPAGLDLSNYGVRIEPDKRVMLVLATLEVARTADASGNPAPVINTKLSEQGVRFRELLKSDFAAVNDDLRGRISQFVLSHKKRNSGKTDEELIAPFISMAYTLAPVPDLADPVVTHDLPGSLLDVLDFAPLVRDLYRRTNIGANLNEYVKLYQTSADSHLRPSARAMISDILGYLHTRPQLVYTERVRTQTQKSGSKSSTLEKIEQRERERRFMIVPEMLAPVGYVNFVNIKDDYYAVVPPDSDLTNSEVRRAYLQFVVDPLINARAKDVETVRPAIKQLLDERRKADPTTTPDVYLALSRSLIAAIDAKQIEYFKNRVATERARKKIADLGGTDPTKKIAVELEQAKRENADETILRLSEDYQKGAVLAFYFADQLAGVEDSGTDIAASLREMILSFDAARESGRYESYAEARKRAAAVREVRRKNPITVAEVAESPVTTKLLKVQDTIKANDFAKAESDLKQLLEKYPSEPRVFFNLGRVAAIIADATEDAVKQRAKFLESKVAFENVLRIAATQQKDPSGSRTDPALISLTYVALGRIYEYFGEKSYAVAIYDAAIKMGEIPGGGYAEALAAKQRLLKDQ